MSILTIKDLLDKKEVLKNNKKETRELYIPSLNANIKICKPSRELSLEVAELTDADENAYLIYNCIESPNLRDNELRKSFGVVEPSDIVYEIFELGEVADIAQEIMKFAGFKNGVEVIIKDELKN